MSTTYLFIDGGHLRQYYTESVSQWFNKEGDIDFNELKAQVSAFKLFYYDCLDDQRRDGESETDHKSRVGKQEDWFNTISAVQGAHVRRGMLRGVGKKLRQKEVDVLLAVDMMNHAVRQNMTHAVLLSGDSDFKPLVESLVQMGLFVRIVGDCKHTSPELARAADDSSLLNFEDYFGFSANSLRAEFPLPSERRIVYQRGYFEGDLVEVGKLNETVVSVSRSGEFNAYVPIDDDKHAYVFAHHDLERLKLFLRLKFGDVTWAPGLT